MKTVILATACILSFLVLFFVLACGGGGGGGSISGTATTTTTPLPPAIDNQHLIDSAAYSLEVSALLSDTTLSNTYELVSGPAGMTLSNGILSWTPVNQEGSYEVLLNVVEQSGVVHRYKFSVSVISPEENKAPIIDPISDQVAAIGQEVVIQCVATDLHTPLTYLISGNPSGMSIGSAGKITWQPSAGEEGINYLVTVTVSDRYGKSSTDSFNIGARGNAPYITGFGPVAASFNQLYAYDHVVVLSDYQPIALALENNPAGMTIDGNGLISWTPTIAQTGQSYTVTIKATDSRGTIGTQKFVITTGNVAPIIDASGLPSQAAANELFQYQILATDANTPLSYSLISGPSGMAVGSVSGIITWTPSAIGGPYDVSIRVSDSLGETSDLNFKISAVNGLPKIDLIAEQSATVGIEAQVQVVATDTDAPLAYSLNNQPAGMSIGSTGLIRWTPTNIQEGLTYNVEAVVTDALGAANRRAFTIKVDNLAPQITAVPNQTLNVLTPHTVQVTLFDNNPPFTYSLQNEPAGMTIDQNGEISWTPPNSEQAKAYVVTIKVLDSHPTNPLEQTITANFAINNISPIIDAIADQTEGAGYNFTLDASTYVHSSVEPNLPITYSLTQPGLPADGNPLMNIDPNTGVITWSPVNPGGPYTITLIVTDFAGGQSTESFNITVQAMAIRATLETPSGNGEITVNYTLYDATSTNRDITAEYSINGGSSWNPATAAPGGDGVVNLTTLPPPNGQAHVYNWDSLTDLGYDSYNNVKFRITPSGAGAVPGETGVFSVDNIVQVEIIGPASNTEFSKRALLTYNAKGPYSPAGATLQFQYSTDGSAYNPATRLASDIGNDTTIYPNATLGKYSFVWDAATDLGNAYETNVTFKIVIPPLYGGGEKVSNSFIVRNTGLTERSPWPKMFGYSTENHQKAKYNGPAGPTLNWTAAIRTGDYVSPVIAPDGTIYIGGYHTALGQYGLIALNPEDGSIKWFYQCFAEWPRTTPALGNDGRIYFLARTVAGTYQLLCLTDDGASATLNWGFTGMNYFEYLSDPIIGPDGVIYCPARRTDNWYGVFAINDNGATSAQKYFACWVDYNYPHTTPSIDTAKNRMLTSNRTYYRYTYAFSLDTGANAWRTNYPSSYSYYGTPVIFGDYIYYTQGYYIAKLRVTDGAAGGYTSPCCWGDDFAYMTPAITYDNQILYNWYNNRYWVSSYNTGFGNNWNYDGGGYPRNHFAVCPDNTFFIRFGRYLKKVTTAGALVSGWNYDHAQDRWFTGLATGADESLYSPGRSDADSFRSFGDGLPRIQEVFPDFVRNTEATKIEIYGGAFSTIGGGGGPATEVKLKSGATEIVLATYTVTNYCTIIAEIPAGTAAGTYDIIITTPNGVNTSSNAQITVVDN